MYPTNQYMDPYYYHYRNHNPYSYYPPPGWEAGHPRAIDSSYGPPSYGPWSYNAAMHHPHPPEFHCCCNHSYPPGYYGFRPPFPQELPPHLYYHGPFPQHPNECPSYFVRLPSVDQTPYDYSKFKSHCCGCPNHVCHGGEKNNVKIEEERPDGKPESELKDADNSRIIRYPNNQYPVIWLPSGNIEDKENGQCYELPPRLFKGWVPMGGKKVDDVKQQGEDDQKEKQFQWPIVWMPAGHDKTKQKTKELKEKDEKPHITEETPPSPKINIIPLSWFEDQEPPAKSGSRDHSDRSAAESQPATTELQDGAAVEGHHKYAPVVHRRVDDERQRARENYKTIPVLPEKESNEKKVGTCRTIPVMTQRENVEKKPAVTVKKEEKKATSAERQGENGKGNHSELSTAKHSKLPPVCLRVDPLPRKKSGNGSSRSPSPPTRKDAAKKDMHEAQRQNLELKQSDAKKHTTVSEMKEKSPEEPRKGMGFSNETVPTVSAKHSQEEEVPMSNDRQKVQASSKSVQENTGANTEGVGTQGNTGAETLMGGDKSTQRDSKTFRANLSEADAAVRIQSAYRRYDVRRWQPLDKLRKIRDVHEQMEGVRKQLQSLEASSRKPTEKEHVALGEVIMNLLLKLDTIQGLHACVREARKSVARELISLQEKLDSLCKQPSSGFNHKEEDERIGRAEFVTQTAAPTLTDEASDKEAKDVGLSEAKEISSVNSMELCDAVSSEVNMEVGQDADPSEVKNQKEELCAGTMEVPCEEGKAAEQVESQAVLSTDVCAAALPEQPHDHHESQIEESYAGSQEVNEEEKDVAVTDEGQEMPLMDSMELLHDAAPTVDSSGQEKFMASTGQSFYAEESNAGVSPVVTGDTKAATATESLDNGVATENVWSAEDQTRKAVGVERLELKHDVSPAEEAPDVILEDLLVSLKDAESHSHKHDPTTAADSVMSNVGEQPEEARNMNMQEQVADSTQDSTEEPDGTSETTSETSVDGVEPAASEEPAQAALLEQTSEFNSVPEQVFLVESNKAMQSEAPYVDQKNEDLELTEELDVQESNHSLAEGADQRAETVFPELDSSESLCAYEEGITEYERPETKVSLKSQTAEQHEGVHMHSSCADAQAPKTDERVETLKEAPTGVMGANSVEEVDTHVSGTEECNGTPDDSTVCSVTSVEVETDNQKEEASVQTERKASEVLSASVAPDGVDSDGKKLAEENQKLKALLQKLLSSGNDQMEVITDLSEKVKVLERKLARKKKPKVRVHRPSRHVTAKVH
ncbi:hypothetical protein PR202_gb06792 [Eleusine coracana subsp. coracana]|uniref:BAG domain-containing protein n=1 Tax=Eleusine coracana subsp. coracana TaxID=191504 RepID=A0AAV5E8Q5_ELECO|nr:hypothetical protein QOZ80_2BG0161980 [Eleusine coracana subsp. coracana]GJN19509.1 hypothetical protein PR202_gb06792 [Eleusine coracana subsp. coracana]